MNNDKIPQDNEKGIKIYVVLEHVSHEGDDTVCVTLNEAKAKAAAINRAETAYEDSSFKIEVWRDDKYDGTLDFECWGKLQYMRFGKK